MKIQSLFLSLPLFLSSEYAQAAYHVKHGSAAIFSLRQLSDLRCDPLPQDILNLLGQTLTGLERHGVWIHKGNDNRWVPFTKVVPEMCSFRDAESSAAEIKAVLESKQQIKEGLLAALSTEWKRQLEELVKGHRHDKSKFGLGKAYGSAFIAYYMVELAAAMEGAKMAARNVAYNAAAKSVYQAACQAADNAAYRSAWEAAFNAAGSAAYSAMSGAEIAARYATRDAAARVAKIAIWPALEQKLEVLGSQSAHEIGTISYDLAEMFILLWLIENRHEYIQTAFDASYTEFPAMELYEVKTAIGAEIKKPKLEDNMFIKALWRDLEALEEFVLGK